MKILLLGGAGAQGRVIIADLVKEPEVEKLICADINFGEASKLGKEFEKVKAEEVNARNSDQVNEIAQAADMIINLLAPDYNLEIMEMAVKNGLHYQDLAIADYREDPIDGFKKQLELDGEFSRSKRVAMLQAGSSPGITNLLARDGADQLDSTKSIRIRLYSKLETKEFVPFWWSPEIAWDDMVSPPVVYEEGDYKYLDPFSGPEEYEFPNLGARVVTHHCHEEPITLPQFIEGLRYVDFKYGGPEVSMAEVAYKLGFLNSEPVQVDEKKVRPIDVLLALTPPPPKPEQVERIVDGGVESEEGSLVVEVEGNRQRKRRKILYYGESPGLKESFERIHYATSESYLTGLSAAAFTRLIIKREIKERGVMLPECLDTELRKKVLSWLEEKSILVHKEEQILK